MRRHVVSRHTDSMMSSLSFILHIPWST